jgi:sortase (surface protein transpeptidase)
MKKIFGFLIILILIAGGIIVGTNLSHKVSTKNPTQSVLPAHTVRPTDPQTTTAPEQKSVAVPQRIQIPKIGVDAIVESVGMDSQGRMDIPSNSDNTAWYNLGYKPGENGNAVIDGHLDKVSSAPAVFWNIKSLTEGDKIIITDANGSTYTFSVTNVVNYPWDNFPIKTVFGSADKPKLNLITCQGSWDQSSHNYSNRTVVFSEAE